MTCYFNMWIHEGGQHLGIPLILNNLASYEIISCSYLSVCHLVYGLLLHCVELLSSAMITASYCFKLL